MNGLRLKYKVTQKSHALVRKYQKKDPRDDSGYKEF